MRRFSAAKLPWNRKPKLAPLSSEQIARAFADKRSTLPTEQYAEQTAGESSSRRAEIARGKQPMELVDEDSDNEADECAPPVVKKRVRRRTQPHTDQFFTALMSMDFAGTRYPHSETMKTLGISRDVGYLLDMCHLGTFMSYQFEGYKEETCSFLATLAVHFYEDDPEADPNRGLGYITFSAQGTECSLTTNELDTLFAFPSGTDPNKDFDET